MTNDTLVINAGSSSIKAALYRGHAQEERSLILSGKVDGIGTPHPSALAIEVSGKTLLDQKWSKDAGPRDHAAAMALIVQMLNDRDPNWQPGAVGHRVVHGGIHFRKPTIINQEVLAVLEQLSSLAPLHLPPNLKGIDAAARAFPKAAQVACFDTAFHQGHPWVADTYALPRALYDLGIRRYGFHGLSYAYIARAMKSVAPDRSLGRLIVAHLGNGASVCALRDGRSVDSSMGFSALDGLPMGTRCGQIDPGVLLYLLTVQKMTPAALMELLYKQSGLLGLSGVSSDTRDLLASDRPQAAQAVDYFIYRLVGHIGMLTANLGGLDGLIFTGGIGENAAPIRARVCRALAWLGVELDDRANDRNGTLITGPNSKVPAWVIPTDEEKMIAMFVRELLGT